MTDPEVTARTAGITRLPLAGLRVALNSWSDGRSSHRFGFGDDMAMAALSGPTREASRGSTRRSDDAFIRPHPGSATDAVAAVCGLRRVDHPDDLQLDARRQHLEQPSADTEQHRDLVDLQLVQHAGLERALGRV